MVFSDGSDISSEIKTLFTRTNVLCRRFKRCSLAVKVRLLRTFCVCFYNAALRLNSTTRARPDPTRPDRTRVCDGQAGCMCTRPSERTDLTRYGETTSNVDSIAELSRSSAIAEGPRDASCQLKSCQLPRNSAETTYTTSPDQIDGMKLEISSEAMRDRQCALNHDATESAPIVSGVINKPTTVELCISPVYRQSINQSIIV